MNREAGILYVSTGKKYNLETVRSARSAKKHMPSTPIALFTDEQPTLDDSSLFSEINIIKEPTFSFFDKICPLRETPFKKTLFVDTDTVFLCSTVELFLLLDKFDLAYCHAPWRIGSGENNRVQEVPECFPEANTGVLAYKKSEDFLNLVDEWEKIYSAQRNTPIPPKHDQPAFRKALYSSPIDSYVLPPEYNLRTPLPMLKYGGINAKILHGRGASLEQAILEIRADDKRFYYYNFSDQSSILNRVKRLTRRFVGRAKDARR
jgi:hypothetical protein